MSRRFWPSLVFSALLPAEHVSANNAVDINTNTQNQKHVQMAITEWGSDFYYAIMSCMGATALGIVATPYTKPRSDRVFFYLCATIYMVATVAYFAMGSNLG
jgi:bacteriorhodopsin